MPKTRTPHLQREIRNGRTIYYFRKGAGPRTRIDHDYGTSKFWAEYRSLFGVNWTISFDARDIERDAAKYRFARRIGQLLVQCRQKAIANRRDFDLTLEWLNNEFERQDYRCALTGIQFQAGRSVGTWMNPRAPSLDRIDCARGYVKDNVRLILASVNLALNDFGLSHFDQVVMARMQRISKERTNGKL